MRSSSKDSIRHAAGSLLVVGLSGTELTGLERAWLKLIQPAGVILFRRNIADAQQTRALLAEATAHCTTAHLRCVDVEGGTVDRLRDAVAPVPSAQAVANTADAHLMQKHGELIAKEVRAFGFNTTLAPVLDQALPASAKVMGTRAVAAYPAGIVQYVRAFMHGLNAHGVTGCGKHFPGLGGGTLDSHLETPSIRRSWKEMWDQDLVPYRELVRELPMVMINHAAYPDTKSGVSPATASAFWPTTVLQKRIGYKGLIFSDDMEMGGILKFAPMEEAAILAIRAGLHLLEICHSPELILRCYESLIHESERSASFRKLLLDRAKVSARLRKARFAAEPSRALSATQLQSLREAVLRFGEKVQRLQPAELTR
jgi:beta-N-acetylhexosaminidase